MDRFIDSQRFRDRCDVLRGFGGEGRGMVSENVEARLSAVEKSCAEFKAVLPHLATKEDVATLKMELGARINTVEAKVGTLDVKIDALNTRVTELLPHLATKADVVEVKGDVVAVRGELAAVEGRLATAMGRMESALIKWIIGTALAAVALALGVARVFA